MATLTIKKFPDDLYERLRERADRHRRSINSESIACFEEILAARPRDPSSIVAEAQAIYQRLGRRLPDRIAEVTGLDTLIASTVVLEVVTSWIQAQAPRQHLSRRVRLAPCAPTSRSHAFVPDLPLIM